MFGLLITVGAIQTQFNSLANIQYYYFYYYQLNLIMTKKLRANNKRAAAEAVEGVDGVDGAERAPPKKLARGKSK